MTDTIVLTVPHRCYPNTADPGCDIMAYKHALALRLRLVRSGYNIVLFSSELPRHAVDQNRNAGANAPMRLRLRRFLQDISRSCKVVLLDIHSFPPEQTGWSPIFLMSGSYKTHALKLLEVVRKSRPNTGYGFSPVNNIVQEASVQHYIPAVLIELSDQWDGETDYDVVVEAIVKWSPPASRVRPICAEQSDQATDL